MLGIGIVLMGTHMAHEEREAHYTYRQLMVADDEGMLYRPPPPDPRFVSPTLWFLPDEAKKAMERGGARAWREQYLQDPVVYEDMPVPPFTPADQETLDWIAGYTVTTELCCIDEDEDPPVITHIDYTPRLIAVCPHGISLQFRCGECILEGRQK